jgi:hypothetical protein
MESMQMRTALLAVLAFTVLPAAGVAADGDAERCRAIAAPGDRLACWDALYPPTATNPTPAAAPVDARAAFGLTAGQRLERERRAEDVPDRIDATVTAVALERDRRRRITLEDGQVWLLPPATTRDRVDEGDRVEIRKAALGSFLLRTEAGIDVRARRVR